jgi:hypothetical protein
MVQRERRERAVIRDGDELGAARGGRPQGLTRRGVERREARSLAKHHHSACN